MNGVDYQPQAPSPNKKHAKAMAATVALQALGEVTEKKEFKRIPTIHGVFLNILDVQIPDVWHSFNLKVTLQ